MLPESVLKTIEKVRTKWDPQYDVVVSRFVPWAPLRRPLHESRLALVSSAGLYLSGVHEPFAAAHPHGDPTFREIPVDTPLTSLGFAHDHYDHALAEEDANVVFPLDRLRALEDAGEIGALARGTTASWAT